MQSKYSGLGLEKSWNKNGNEKLYFRLKKFDVNLEGDIEENIEFHTALGKSIWGSGP